MRNGEQAVCWTVQKQNTIKEPRESIRFNDILNTNVPVSPPLILHAFLKSGTHKSISSSWANRPLAQYIAGCMFFRTKTRTQQNGINQSILPTPASRHFSSVKSQDMRGSTTLPFCTFILLLLFAALLRITQWAKDKFALAIWMAGLPCCCGSSKNCDFCKTSALLQNLFVGFFWPNYERCPIHILRKILLDWHTICFWWGIPLYSTPLQRSIWYPHHWAKLHWDTAPHIIYLHVTLIYHRGRRMTSLRFIHYRGRRRTSLRFVHYRDRP